MEVDIGTRGGHPAPVQRHRAQVSLRGERRRFHQRHGQVHRQPLVIHQCQGGRQRLRDRTDPHGFTVELGTHPAPRCEQLVAHRIIDDAEHHLLPHRERQRAGEHLETVREIGGTIQGIEDPATFGACKRPLLAVAAGLLPEKGVLGPVVGQVVHHRLLHSPVRLGHQAAVLLEHHPDVVKAAHQFPAGQRPDRLLEPVPGRLFGEGSPGDHGACSSRRVTSE